MEILTGEAADRLRTEILDRAEAYCLEYWKTLSLYVPMRVMAQRFGKLTRRLDSNIEAVLRGAPDRFRVMMNQRGGLVVLSLAVDRFIDESGVFDLSTVKKS